MLNTSYKRVYLLEYILYLLVNHVLQILNSDWLSYCGLLMKNVDFEKKNMAPRSNAHSMYWTLKVPLAGPLVFALLGY